MVQKLNVHFIVHEYFEGPGAFLLWANSKDYRVSYSRVYLQEPLPLDADQIDILIVLGGPQSPATTLSECAYFDKQKETALIKQCIEADKIVLGVCLGAQLIGEALGAQFEHSPHREVGYFSINLTPEGRQNSKLAHFATQEVVGHWHNDMPGLTPDSKILATSEGCPRQIVQYQDRVYGFQCHLEFTHDTLSHLIENALGDITQAKADDYVQTPQTIMGHDHREMNALLMGFLDHLVIDYCR
ncbi:glutamine amidotransferase-related protein [Motilimonas eburnea]|uniref:glutamine amidotransferase-related protein n=1 Tax=Motilimonas eburnea TaxID=1737488 RepID=UPI001E317CF4|nr:glutamine amidotransferase [Motilimonas eburnea]MCE2572956.1 glutamine amidotransferase [Motilimonas eburnea]